MQKDPRGTKISQASKCSSQRSQIAEKGSRRVSKSLPQALLSQEWGTCHMESQEVFKAEDVSGT